VVHLVRGMRDEGSPLAMLNDELVMAIESFVHPRGRRPLNDSTVADIVAGATWEFNSLQN
jgi:hypothetical protein